MSTIQGNDIVTSKKSFIDSSAGRQLLPFIWCCLTDLNILNFDQHKLTSRFEFLNLISGGNLCDCQYSTPVQSSATLERPEVKIYQWRTSSLNSNTSPNLEPRPSDVPYRFDLSLFANTLKTLE